MVMRVRWLPRRITSAPLQDALNQCRDGAGGVQCGGCRAPIGTAQDANGSHAHGTSPFDVAMGIVADEHATRRIHMQPFSRDQERCGVRFTEAAAVLAGKDDGIDEALQT